MYRKLRIVLAAVFFIGITLLLTGFWHKGLSWMSHAQFVPSVMRVIGSAAWWNIAIVATILLITLAFGRIYCSVICPLGIFQDIICYISGLRKGKKRRFGYRKENKLLRRVFLTAFVAAMVFGIQLIPAILGPYSAYGRIISAVVDPKTAGLAVILIASATLLTTGIMAWTAGRLYCNSICPVGTFLGLISRYAFWRPVVDHDKCVKCGACGKKCKASCIDTEAGVVDMSRCVDCFDCIDNCSVGAISISHGRLRVSAQADSSSEHPQQPSRRAFLSGAALAATSLALKAQDIKVDGGLAEVTPKQAPQRATRIVPPGAVSLKHFYDRCTACQLCVSSCPNGVLRPSTDFDHFMQPQSSYEKGWCRPECTVCSEVCPAGAILPLSPEEKTGVKVGKAVVNIGLCISHEEGVSCANCARHCPTGAIRMHKDPEGGRMMPTVDESRCIGCGACEYLCPARPISAITVEGYSSHIID